MEENYFLVDPFDEIIIFCGSMEDCKFYQRTMHAGLSIVSVEQLTEKMYLSTYYSKEIY